jgi:tetratricopeptide (TPR) repeat protein
MLLQLALSVALASLLVGCFTPSPYMAANQSLLAGDYASASTRYAAILDKDPEDWPSRVRYGYSLLREEKYAEALEEFKTAMISQGNTPQRHWAVFYAGLSEAAMGHADRAVAYWTGYANTYWPLTEVVREAAARLRSEPSAANPAFAQDVLDKMSHARAREMAYNRAHWFSGSQAQTGSFPEFNDELRITDPQSLPYLP